MATNPKDKVILAIGAHPDDIEFACGGSVAKYTTAGAKAYIVICTNGNRGSRNHDFKKAELIKNRQSEQALAAKILGVEKVFFLGHEDGNLVADIKLKEQIVKLIRILKPDIIFTHDPAWFYKTRDGLAVVNHTDHRATGMAVLDAVYPLSRDILSFPEHAKVGLTPHHVPELLLFDFDSPNFLINVTDTVDLKMDSIKAHKSQIDTPLEMEKRIKGILAKLGRKKRYKYAEGFIQLKFA